MVQQPKPKMAAPEARGTDPGETALVGVYEISKLLASVNRLEVNLAGVLTLLSSFLDMRHGLIALLDKSGTPEIVVGSGWSEPIFFYPDGTTSNAQLLLRNKEGRMIELFLHGLTGIVKVSDVTAAGGQGNL